MTSNTPNNWVTVKCDDTGVGRTFVKGADPSEIDMVRISGNFGSPSIHPAKNPGDCIVQVLGALSGSEVVVEFYTPHSYVEQSDAPAKEIDNADGAKTDGSGDSGDSNQSSSSKSKTTSSSK